MVTRRPAKQIEVSEEIIGKHEKAEAMPSIKAAKKIANTFEISLDYLAGEGVNSAFDKKLKRLQDIEKIDLTEKDHIFAMLDAFLTKRKF